MRRLANRIATLEQCRKELPTLIVIGDESVADAKQRDRKELGYAGAYRCAVRVRPASVYRDLEAAYAAQAPQSQIESLWDRMGSLEWLA